jgi:hypothetical protein
MATDQYIDKSDVVIVIVQSIILSKAWTRKAMKIEPLHYYKTWVFNVSKELWHKKNSKFGKC